MASLFSARRKPKRIVREDQTGNDQVDIDEDIGPVVRRPTTAPKSQSKLRLSFNPGESNTAEEELTDKISKPNRLGASNAAKELPRHTATLNLSDRQDHDRPSYSKSYLDELRNSTPSTPKDLSLYNSSTEDDQDISTAVDVAAKFGNIPRGGSAIPSAAEIREKKERRARLAKEQLVNVSEKGDGFISLEDYDSDGEFKPQRMQVGSYNHPINDEKDTRLLREDEDIAEGFDEFVEDDPSNRILMSNLGRREVNKKEVQKRKAMIEEAEGSEEDDDTDSDASLRHAYESAQTHHGMEGLEARKMKERIANRPKQPEKTTQIPSLATALSRIRELIQQAEIKRVEAEKRRKEIEQEKIDVNAEKEQIQKSLTELGKELEQSMIKTNGEIRDEPQSQARGLESFGAG